MCTLKSGYAITTSLKRGKGLEFPWIGSSQKSCKNSDHRLGAAADLKGMAIFHIKYPQ